MSRPAQVVERLTGARVRRERGASRFELDDGRVAVLKNGASDPGSVAAEAAGLAWIAVPGGPPVPDVLGADDEWLVTTLVETGRPTREHAAELGRRLAVLHDTGADGFGAAPPGGPELAWIGHTRMRNGADAASWPQWYAEHRVEPYVRAARDAGDLDDTTVFEQVFARLPELAGPPEPPARLHGDLWSGNVLWGPHYAWLIDPAAHGGHRETDLAMLDLFGLPHLDAVRDGYRETSPLADGWEARIPLHQLFPLLVHTVLFGGGYAGQAVAAARAALRV
ncbi:fructosamine-3-kinase [Pseudonocardia sediminis]|uniref:Fructosamine-3-kinase n=1 Tax=Pseudonocardia sediminis TaxID=1397368 RepID=A0A4Q7UWF6_PSEST|nr:fructosamine kinase family protein [Pseudonocardia sediminis]RZT85318.1 fructosamine-3-kinase [Pseudonocardia sediminis]